MIRFNYLLFAPAHPFRLPDLVILDCDLLSIITVPSPRNTLAREEFIINNCCDLLSVITVPSPMNTLLDGW